MNRYFTLIVFLILSLCYNTNLAQAQSVDLILKKHIEASGGAENLTNLNSIIYEGEAIMGSLKADFTIKQLNPDYVLTSINMPSVEMHQLYDGNKGWIIQSMNGQSSTQEMDAETTARLKLQGDLQGPLVNHAEKGISVTFDSFSDEYGDPLIKLYVTYSDGRPEQFYYLDIDTFLTVRTKVEEPITDPNSGLNEGGSVVVETKMENYKEVNGLMLPHKLITYSDGTKVSELTMSSVQINPGSLSPSDFHLEKFTSN